MSGHENNATLFVLLFFIGFIVVVFITSLFLQRRSVISVIKTFRSKNAFDENNTISQAEVGIRPQHALLKKRDYKLQALQFLINVQIIRATEAGMLYLSEETLASLSREGSTLAKILLPK